jgi:hypothetical protein
LNSLVLLTAPEAASAAISRLAAAGLDDTLAAKLSGVEVRPAGVSAARSRIRSDEPLVVERDLPTGRLADPAPEADQPSPATSRTTAQLRRLDPRAVDRLDLSAIASDEAAQISSVTCLAAAGDPSPDQLSLRRGRAGGEAAADVVFASEG